jgi:hypothetical protein
MSYAITDFSPTQLELNDGLRSYYYKKCYCSVELQGEYIIFTAHRVENNAFRQQWSVAYTDFTTPTGSSSAVLAAIQTIIDSYAGGGTPTPTGYYGMWQDNFTQTAPSSNVGLAMIFRTTDLSNGVSVVTNGTNLTRITFANTGIYNLQFSSQFQNVDNALHDVTIWLRLNGSDVAGSSGFISVPQRKNPSEPGHIVVSWNYLLDVVAGQYYELYWSTTNHTNVSMKFYPAGSPPPSTASVILTVTQQAGIMAGTGITAINSLTGAAQTLGVGTSGIDFAVSSSGTAHTLNLPTASATNRGALSTTDWSTFNNKLTGFGQYRKAGRWYNNGFFPPANGSFGNVNGVIRYVPVLLDQDITLTRIGINVTAVAPTSSLCRLGIYSNDPTTTQPLNRIIDAGTVTLDGSTGQRSITGLSVALTKGLYWFAYFSNAASGTITGIGSGATFDVKGQANIGATGFAAFSQSLGFTTLPATVGTLTETNSGSTVCIYYYY